MSPLVVLVGKNSTGKSYMAMLLWWILSSDSILNVPLPSWFTDTIKRSHNHGGKEHVDFSVKRAQDWLNKGWADNLKRNLERLFSSDAVKAGKIEVELRPRDAISLVHTPFSKGENEGASAAWGPNEDGTIHFSVRPELGNSAWGPFAAVLRELLIGDTFFFPHVSDCIYIPAARTGLVLALGSLVSDSLGGLAAARQFKPQTTLPLPTVRFLQYLSRTTDHPTNFSTTAAFLEDSVLKGKIKVEKGDGTRTPDYFFARDNFGQLPLYVTSSMVTELAPIIIAMRQNHGSYFIIEEPEAHLHLSGQRQMARAIVRLVNSGAKVVLTTHSDTFLQQLNLSIALGANLKAFRQFSQTYGYERVDTLAPGNARCYEFLNNGSGTIINEIVASDEGFAVPSINEALYELTDEVRAFQNDTNNQ